MRGRRFWATGLGAVLVLAGCSLTGYGEHIERSDGVRTDPDQQGLVVSYTGGACDGPARLKLTETPTRIDADVVIGGGGGGACIAVGIPSTLSSRLDQPVGSRTIYSAGREQIPFDGTRLLVPRALPPGFTGVTERGSGDPTATDTDAVDVTSTWVTRRSGASEIAPDGSCRSGRGSVEIRLGPPSERLGRGRTKVGTVAIGSVKAQVYRDGSRKKPIAWAYGWSTRGGSVLLASYPECAGGQPLDRSELLRVARSLRPA